MAKNSRGRKQDRARVASGQKYEVRYEAKKTGRSGAAVRRAVKKVGVGRKKVERQHSDAKSFDREGPSAAPRRRGGMPQPPPTRSTYGMRPAISAS